jgi:hypothetical protein
VRAALADAEKVLARLAGAHETVAAALTHGPAEGR